MLYDLSLHIGYRYEVPASGAHHMLRLLPLSLPDRQRLIAGAITVTISIGLAVAEAGDASFDRVLARADAAMYQAKAAGRNQACPAAVVGLSAC